jgi:hypothetical protein
MHASQMASVSKAGHPKILGENYVLKTQIIEKEAFIMPEVVAELVGSHREKEKGIELDGYSMLSSQLK